MIVYESQHNLSNECRQGTQGREVEIGFGMESGIPGIPAMRLCIEERSNRRTQEQHEGKAKESVMTP